MEHEDLVKIAPMFLDLPEVESKMLLARQVECPVYHHFGPSIYIREVNMPAGALVLGHYQKMSQMNVFLKGRISIFLDDGRVKEIIAPMIFTAGPGRKFGYVHEDVVWLNIYSTDEKDIDKLENWIIDKSDIWKRLQPEEIQRAEDVADFYQAIKQYGFDYETVKKQSENTDDLIPFPHGTYSVAVYKSQINGKGLFATAAFKEGDFIAPARINGRRTPAGRYVNHSKNPNSKFVFYGSDIILTALRDIAGCRGGIRGDEITSDYRESLKLLGVKKCQE